MSYFIRVLIVVLTCLLAQNVIAKPVPSEHYSRMPAIYDAAISPNGKFLATVIDSKGQYIVRVFNLADKNDKTVRAISYGGKLKVGWIKWASNETLLISTRQNGKLDGLVYQTRYLYAANVDLKDVRMVLEPKIETPAIGSRLRMDVTYRQWNDIVVDFLPDDPDHILMQFNVDSNIGGDVHKMNLKTGTFSKVKGGSKSIQE